MGVARGADGMRPPPFARFVSAREMPDAYWRSLFYFSLYRLAVAAVFLAAAFLTGGSLNLGSHDLTLFMQVDVAYLVMALLFVVTVIRHRYGFNAQLTVHVVLDVIALTLLMYASGGIQSGVAVMLFVVLAGAGLVGQGRLVILYAALAAWGLMAEQAYRVMRFDADPAAFFRTGLTALGFFGIAISARLLARRVVANEVLARQRGLELADQQRINERIIRDMDDGVLVVDQGGHVRQCNPAAMALLRGGMIRNPDLASLSFELAQQYLRWQAGEGGEVMLHSPIGGRAVRARCLPPTDGGAALIYLEDIGRAEAQAQQIKLAALGRLTANMAHEIRNPLAAISHAAELLADEQRADTRRRLTRIIGDNAQRLNRLVVDILEVGKRERVQPQKIDLSAFLSQFLAELAVVDPSVRQRVALDVPPQSEVCFDRSHLHRVMSNLLDNALRYATGSEDAIRISVIPTGARSEAQLELHVTDDGPGIPVAVRGQVFEPFFTTHGSGTGLGLYIARELCDANRARIELLDCDAGAHFRILMSGEACQVSQNVGNAGN